MTKAVELAQVASTGVSETFKNKIINGAMVFDQRNNGASVNVTSSSFITDRFNVNLGGTSAVIACQQVSDAPTGFVNSLKLTISTTATPSSSQFLFLRQVIEGFNIADLGWGTANALTVTLSFWVKASITGTYSAFAINNAEDRSYVATFTVNASNTWEYKTITIPGDTTGTWLTNNSNGIRLGFDLGSGSNFNGTANAWQSGWEQRTSSTVNLVGNLGATFQITGVQLEIGSSATNFEYRSYGTELALCQRYFQSLTFGTGNASYGPYGLCRNAVVLCVSASLPVQMRTAPSVNFVNSSANVLKQDGGTFAVSSFIASGMSVNQIGFEAQIGTSSLNTTGAAGFYGGSFVINGASEL